MRFASEMPVLSSRVFATTVVVSFGLAAQEQPAAERMAPMTRAAQIELERQAKAATIRTETPTRAESRLNFIKRSNLIDLFTDGVDGFRIRLGGLPPGSGLTAGPEYYRPDLWDGRAVFRTSVRGSWRKFYMMDAALSLPKLA